MNMNEMQWDGIIDPDGNFIPVIDPIEYDDIEAFIALGKADVPTKDGVMVPTVIVTLFCVSILSGEAFPVKVMKTWPLSEVRCLYSNPKEWEGGEKDMAAKVKKAPMKKAAAKKVPATKKGGKKC